MHFGYQRCLLVRGPLCNLSVKVFCFTLHVYFLLRFQIRKTKEVSVFNVGFAGGVYYEGPVCGEDGRVREWHSPSAEWRYGMDRAVPDLYVVFKINIVCNLAQLKRGT